VLIDDLAVVVEETGNVAVQGTAAMRRLASRAGRWRMLASSPGLIVFARAEDGVVEMPAPLVPFAGEIEAVGGLSDVIALIQQNRWSGTLHTIDGLAYRAVWFKSGDVRTTGSNLPQDRLGEIFYRYGVVSREDLDRALLRTGPDQRIGQALIDLGLVSSHDVFSFVKKQVEEVFFTVVRLRRGSFYFERTSGDEKLPDLALSTQKLLLEATRRMDEMKYFREKIPSGESVPVLRFTDFVPAEERARAVFELVDGRRTVEEIGRDSKLGEFDATRVLFQLLQAGVIEIKQEIEVLHSGLPMQAAPTDAPDLLHLMSVVNDLLVQIQRVLSAANKLDRFRADLGAFFRGATAYSPLFEKVEVDAEGRLSGDRIIQNLDRARVSDRAGYLQQAFNELLCFLLFSAGDSIGRQHQHVLSQHLTEALRTIDRQPRS
jgi:hypothetical protein